MQGKKILFITALLLIQFNLKAQLPSLIFKQIEIKVDTLSFNSVDHLIRFNDENHLYFEIGENSPVCEIRLTPFEPEVMERLTLIKSGDYDILDSLINVNNEYFRFRIQFKNLTATDFLNFTFSEISEDSLDSRIHIVPLLPVTKTIVEFDTEDTELFVGEEKVYELTTNNLQNIRVDNIWTRDNAVNYRLTEDNSRLILHVSSQRLGWQTLRLRIRAKIPYITDLGEVKFELPVITQEFNVKASRLRFLRIDEEEIILDPQKREGYAIQLENNPYFQLQRTYRIESQEEPGGPLVAELFTRSYLTNGRILCWFRPFAMHRKSDGYLYIKEDDVARFITNVNIIPRPEIEEIQILREGSDWTSNLNVYPGEAIELRIEGKSLHRTNFTFENVHDFSPDTLVRNENLTNFQLKIPVNIINKKITIYNHGKTTGYALNVKEYERPRPLDFVYLRGNGFRQRLSTAGNNIMVQNILQEVNIEFDRDVIDLEGKLFGVQHLNIEITVRGKDNELIESEEIENVAVCPGELSPRSQYYQANCQTGEISVNNHLSKKTYDLDEWSKVIIEISHNTDKYGGDGYSERVEVIIQKFWRFDIDVSFPAGLLTFGGSNSGNLTGISMAMIAQFSFYEKDRINRFRPYKAGLGFIALDAFNFSENDDNRDVAMVLLGSLYPTRRDSKLTFPLFMGGGYKLKNQEFFFLVGPGIRVRL